MRMDWNGDWERELGKEIRRHYQRTFTRLGRTLEGRPKDEIRKALIRELELNGDPDESWVDAIHEGTKINIQFEWS